MRIVVTSLLVVGACASGATMSSIVREPTVTNGGANASTAVAPELSERHPALAPLRPSGSEEVLSRLEHDPVAEAYANAANFYSATDVRGMALLWGLTYGALAFDGPHRQDVAASMTRVLREGIIIHDDGISVRFAPGAMPVIQQADGSMRAPVAHLYEQYFSTAFVMIESSEWPPTEIYRTMAAYLPRRPTPLDQLLTLHVWLRVLEDAGHMHGFIAHVFDIATPLDEETVTEAREWIMQHPFVAPTRGTAPDDLVALE